MIGQIEQHLMAHWEKYFACKPESIQSLLLTSAQGKKIGNSKCTILIFVDNKEIPDLVCKFARVRGSICEIKIQNEVKILQEVNLTISQGDFPRSFAPLKIKGKIVSVEEYRPGQSLKDYLIEYVNKYEINDLSKLESIIQTDIESIKNLLLKLNRLELTDSSKNNSSDYIDISLNDFDELNKYLKLSNEYVDVVQKVIVNYKKRTRLSSSVFVHSDFTPSNLIRNRGDLSLIDLEFSDISVHRFIDPSRFIFFYFQILNDLALFPFNSFIKNFYYFFFEHEQMKAKIEGLFQSLNLEDIKYSEYIMLFLICNVQLQISEVGIYRINNQFLEITSQLIKLIIDILKNKSIDIPDIVTNDVYVGWSDYELKRELKKLNNKLINLQQQQVRDAEYIQQCLDVIKVKDDELAQNLSYIKKCQDTIEYKDRELAQNLSYIKKCQETIASKDRELAQNVIYIEKCHAQILDYEKQIAGFSVDLSKVKEDYENKLEIKENEIQSKELELSSLTEQFSNLEHKYKKTLSYKIRLILNRLKSK